MSQMTPEFWSGDQYDAEAQRLYEAGDYEGALELTNTKGVIGEQLQADLDRLTRASIPVDITFNQGVAELGLE